MTRKTLNIMLMVLMATAAGLNLAVGISHREPNVRFIPEMVGSVPYDGYAPNPYFKNGATLRVPPAGLISGSILPLHYDSTSEDAVRAGEELNNPFRAESTAVAYEGAYLYRDYCFPCHGAEGSGDGPVSLRGYPAPPSFASEKNLRMNDGQMFHIITFGQNNMPGYGSQLTREERWKVILHLRTLQERVLAGLRRRE